MIPHDFSPRFSTSTGMFLIQQPAITTDMKTQEEMVETPCHLFFYPDDQLDKHDVSMTPYFIERDTDPISQNAVI